ncbi:hypothetical protein ABZZ79_13230 [Streptomyces sp. NPDC006458]|uniref:hypothetical protein n=1 Tax=Streptomyces sp. NPDC006458 TaxID=3154302 RepID=UPI0033B3CA9E
MVSEEIWVGGVGAMLLAEGIPLRTALYVTDPAKWTAFDLGVRDHCPPALLPSAERVRPGRLRSRLLRVKDLTEPELALALCHHDGRVREAALDRAADRPDLLPLLVIRSADWVAPVRERARALLAERLDVPRAAALAPLILRVGRRERGTHAVELLGEVLRLAPPELLRPLCGAEDRAVRRFAVRLAVRLGYFSPAELARTAARDSDVTLQDLCADTALAAVRESGAYDDVLPALLGARGPRPRAAGVTALRTAGRYAQAEPFLADRSALVRACARYVVRQGEGDPVTWYRERCAVEAVPGAVIGLAECGDRADAALLWTLIDHPTPAVRARAVAGLRLLDSVDAGRLLPLLDDPAPSVVRETTLALLPSARSLPQDWLSERAAPDRPRQVRLAAFRLLHACDGLTRLRAAVALLDDCDPKMRAWAESSVQGWHAGPRVPLCDPEVGALLDRAGYLFSDYVLVRRKREAGLPA